MKPINLFNIFCSLFKELIIGLIPNLLEFKIIQNSLTTVFDV